MTEEPLSIEPETPALLLQDIMGPVATKLLADSILLLFDLETGCCIRWAVGPVDSGRRLPLVRGNRRGLGAVHFRRYPRHAQQRGGFGHACACPAYAGRSECTGDPKQ